MKLARARLIAPMSARLRAALAMRVGPALMRVTALLVIVTLLEVWLWCKFLAMGR